MEPAPHQQRTITIEPEGSFSRAFFCRQFLVYDRREAGEIRASAATAWIRRRIAYGCPDLLQRFTLRNQIFDLRPLSFNKPPMAARRGTKTAKILALLRRPAGASLPELRKATGWQPHSVRGFLSGAVKKKMGLHIDAVARDDGERAYRVASK